MGKKGEAPIGNKNAEKWPEGKGYWMAEHAEYVIFANSSKHGVKFKRAAMMEWQENSESEDENN